MHDHVLKMLKFAGSFAAGNFRSVSKHVSDLNGSSGRSVTVHAVDEGMEF